MVDILIVTAKPVFLTKGIPACF